MFHPHGTDNALIADATDLVEAMASATGRGPLRWADEDKVEEDEEGVEVATPAGGRRGECFGVAGHGDYAFFPSHYRDEAGCTRGCYSRSSSRRSAGRCTSTPPTPTTSRASSPKACLLRGGSYSTRGGSYSRDRATCATSSRNERPSTRLKTSGQISWPAYWLTFSPTPL